MNIISWIILGALAGWIASIIMKKNSQMGGFANIVVGILGAFIGGLIVQFIGGRGVTGFNIWSLVVAIIGSVLLLWIVNIFTKNKSGSAQR
ncbi:MAG: GlsB/YeaQ/YmgE family stress response membrane protein [Clostridiales bacterium]|jgi:uncharacterized membrane protein YeaQ/YmgE (transglycosylase-associated protein family)|nr:GlsB/YeaQ/YmgE family stress response membrane protein [Clostridiales bacterium]